VRGGPRESPRRKRSPAASSPVPVPLRHPGFLLAAAVAFAALMVTVTFKFFDYDLWEHLVVGKYIWTTRSIPVTQLWTWPTLDQPAMVPSWAFRALLWPLWNWGGVPGLFTWRWLTTILTFGLLFATARRMRADPLVTLLVLVLAALTYRGRTMVRPETLALVLMAAQLWVLTSRRAGLGRDLWLVAIAWAWINVHVSFFIGFAQLAFHGIGALWSARSARSDPAFASSHVRAATSLIGVGLAALAISFVNPFGWHAVVQPLDFLLHGRAEPIYQAVGELGGIDWRINWKNGLPLLMVGWPLLILWRARRGLELTEVLTCVFFSALALFSQRFKAAYVVAAAPYVARDLTHLLADLRPTPLALPAGARGVVVSIAIVAMGWWEWSLPQFPIGVGLDMRYVPVGACDFIERAGIRGRAFNHFWYGGYMEYRFWPQRDRLPFIDGHLESGTEHDRTLYTYAQSDPAAWHELDREKQFDFALLTLKTPSGLAIREALEADSTWAAVFIDDAAVVFVRRGGMLEPVARRWAYESLRVAPAGFDRMMSRCVSDTSYRRAVALEFERQVSESPYTAVAHSLLAELALMDGRKADARTHLELAIVADPGLESARDRLREIP